MYQNVKIWSHILIIIHDYLSHIKDICTCIYTVMFLKLHRKVNKTKTMFSLYEILVDFLAQIFCIYNRGPKNTLDWLDVFLWGFNLIMIYLFWKKQQHSVRLVSKQLCNLSYLIFARTKIMYLRKNIRKYDGANVNWFYRKLQFN